MGATLKALLALGKIEQSGTGRKGDKHRYRIRFPVPTLVPESGIEYERPHDEEEPVAEEAVPAEEPVWIRW